MNQTMLQGRLAIFRINYKSDFIITLNSDAGWMTPFCIKFWTGAPSQAYFAGWDGTTYTNCAPVAGDPTKLQVQFDDHHLPIGELKYQIGYHFTIADFPTTVEDEVLNQEHVVINHDGQDEKVLLDFNGETAPDIQFSLPAYANEAQRIANEEQRIAHEAIRIVNEEGRIAAEQTRQQNEEQRIAQETARVQEFARLKRESESATSDATAAATLANEKAQLAADKAALAQAAATLANAKAQLAADKAALAASAAQLANDKAALAQQKAEYAQTQGAYAKNQGDYAKQQGDYAKDQGDTALADHLRAEADHETAASDHTRAESDHSTASSDHTQASTDHSTATSDHSTAAADHTQAGNDHTRAESDHSTAASDHTTAGNDHTRAESDHTRAESDHAAVEVYVDSLGAYDISAAHAVGGVLATYANLQAALGINGANIPEGIRKGGMSVKFVQVSAQSSDNKYVQYRLIATTFSTTESDWQGVDDEPTAGSDNLVKSGGVQNELSKIKGGIFTHTYAAQYDEYTLSTPWSSGTIVKNVGEIPVYLYGQDSAGRLNVGRTMTLDRQVTKVKSGAIGNAAILLQGDVSLIIDNEPVYNSNNLVKSGGVYSELSKIKGGTFTHTFGSAYDEYALPVPWPAGTIVKNTGEIVVYLYGTDGYDRLLVGKTITLTRNVVKIKADNTAGDSTIILNSNVTLIVDDEPKENSQYPVKSGGVFDKFQSIHGFMFTHTYAAQYNIYALPTPWPSGTIIKNVGEIPVYIYGMDSAGRLNVGGIIQTDREVTEIKAGLAGTATLRVGGELNVLELQIKTISDREVADMVALNKPLSVKTIMKVGCIGDSFTAGYIKLGDGPVYSNNPNYAWPHYMESLTKNTWLNFGVGGSTAKLWVNSLFSSQGIAAEGNKCQAYVIGLGINDQGDWNPDKVDAGTAEDIGTDNNTFTAWYYKLVQLVVGVNADAKIFLNTEPRNGNNDYNQAIKNVGQYCHDVLNQNVFVCDLALYNNDEYWHNAVFAADATNGHYTAIGYQFMAQCMLRIFSDVINENQDEFKDVFLIPFDE